MTRLAAACSQEELDAKSINMRNRDDVGIKAKTQMAPLDKIVEELVVEEFGKHICVNTNLSEHIKINYPF